MLTETPRLLLVNFRVSLKYINNLIKSKRVLFGDHTQWCVLKDSPGWLGEPEDQTWVRCMQGKLRHSVLSGP